MAAVAATSATSHKLVSGFLNPKSDIAIQVGGANAGTTLSAKTTKNSSASEAIGAFCDRKRHGSRADLDFNLPMWRSHTIGQ